MKFNQKISFLLTLVIFLTSSCIQSKEEKILLTTFSKNSVEVSIYLLVSANGKEHALTAVFTPPEDTHLYGKDIPRNGVDLMGRPTLLELSPNSQMQAAGDLMESPPAELPESAPLELLIYPAGSVTLTLPIILPQGEGWVEDEVSLTFMTCGDRGCKPPVINEIVSLRIPAAGNDAIH